jgi:uncharacterized protein (TIGR00725 family)
MLGVPCWILDIESVAIGNQTMRKIQIGVIGGRRVSQTILKLAEEVGQAIAQRGAVLICGGLGGVMEAACKGAKKAGGTTVGVLPVASPDKANAYVDIPIATDMGVARNSIIVHSCDGVIAVGGRYGTLSEMAFALQKGIPVVSLKSWAPDDSVHIADDPETAVEILFIEIKKQRR